MWSNIPPTTWIRNRGGFLTTFPKPRPSWDDPPVAQVAKALGGEIFTFDGGHDVPMDEAWLPSSLKKNCRFFVWRFFLQMFF